EAVEQVRDYLGDFGYQWLVSAAVYPEVRAELTLQLGSRVAKPFEATILERLARLPWMRYAFFPDWLRGALLDSLRGKAVRRLRIELERLLTSEFGGRVPLTVAFSWAGRLFRPFQRPAKSRDPKLADALQDRVFVTWIDRRLAVRVPRAL